MSIIEIKDLSKAYGSKLALSGVDLDIDKGADRWTHGTKWLRQDDAN